MSTILSFMKSSGLYFLGNILSKLIGFFLLPVYTTYIKPEDLGYYDVANSYLNLIVTFLFIDIYVGIMRFVFDEKDKTYYNYPIYNGFLIFSVSLILYTLVAIIISYNIDIKYNIYIYIYGVCFVFNNLYCYLARALNFNKLFALSGVVVTLVSSVLNIILIVYFGWNIESLFVALIFGLFSQIVIIEYKVHFLRRLSTKYFNSELLIKMFKYSLPLSLNSLAYWLLTGYSNAMIANRLGLEANGYYMIAAKFGLVINLVSTCFNFAWQEMIFKKGNDDRTHLSIFYSRAINLLLIFLAVGIFALIPFSSVIFKYVVSEEYYGAYNIIPVYIVAAMIGVLSSFMGQIYAALKVTSIIMCSTIIACLVNVVLTPLFISYWGILGAIIAIVISYTTNVIMRVLLIKKTVTIHIDIKVLFTLIVSIIFSFLLYYNANVILNIVSLFLLLSVSLFLLRKYIKPLFF